MFLKSLSHQLSLVFSTDGVKTFPHYSSVLRGRSARWRLEVNRQIMLSHFPIPVFGTFFVPWEAINEKAIRACVAKLIEMCA